MSSFPVLDEYWVPRFDSLWCLWEHHVVTRAGHETAFRMADEPSRRYELAADEARRKMNLGKR